MESPLTPLLTLDQRDECDPKLEADEGLQIRRGNGVREGVLDEALHGFFQGPSLAVTPPPTVDRLDPGGVDPAVVDRDGAIQGRQVGLQVGNLGFKVSQDLLFGVQVEGDAGAFLREPLECRGRFFHG